MITTGSIYPLHEYLLLTVLNRGRRLLPGDQLDIPDLEHVDFERAHRVKSKDSSKCPIVVKFTKYKDREQILISAGQKAKGHPLLCTGRFHRESQVLSP